MSLGHEPVITGSGREALDVLARERFDLVLMDCQVPDIDGFETTTAIRARDAQRASPRLPIVALTADAMSRDRERCLAAGFDDYFSKPFGRDDLNAVLQRWLSAIPDAAASVPRCEAQTA
jgi:CheY-like chemotaxis protein